MNKVQPIRSKKKVRELGEEIRKSGEKYYIMYNIGIYTGMRVSDIVSLKKKNISSIRTIKLREQKTNKSNEYIINKPLWDILKKYIENMDDDDYLIPSREGIGQHIGRVRAYQVIKNAANKVGINGLGTHSLRKTFGYWFYKQYKDIATLQRIFKHSDPSITLMYIGITDEEIDDKLDDFKY